MVLEDLFRRSSTFARFRLPPLGPMMDGFCEWLRGRGCSEHGVRRRLRQVSHFNRYLRRRSVKDSQEVTTSHAERFILSPERVLALFTNDARERGLNSRRNSHGALRSFLRFCHQKAYLERDLAEVVPSIRRCRLSDVPRGVSDEDARKSLQGIDRTTPVGRRDFAMIQLLHTYGVRGGQLRALRVEDIRWRENRIQFLACKGGKELVEPLTEEVGESLLD